jgi:hypothetical protein
MLNLLRIILLKKNGPALERPGLLSMIDRIYALLLQRARWRALHLIRGRGRNDSVHPAVFDHLPVMVAVVSENRQE